MFCCWINDYEVVVCGSVNVAWSARGFSVLLRHEVISLVEWLSAVRKITFVPIVVIFMPITIAGDPYSDRDLRLGGCVLLAKRVVLIANWHPHFSLIWKKTQNNDDDHDELSQWGLVRPQSCTTCCPWTHCTWPGSHKAGCAQLAGRQTNSWSNHFIWMRWNRTPSFLKSELRQIWRLINTRCYTATILLFIPMHAAENKQRRGRERSTGLSLSSCCQ